MNDIIVVPDAQLFPEYHPPVFQTKGGTLYLREPGIVMLNKPHVSLAGLAGFFGGYHADLKFMGYLDDPTDLPPGAKLCKFAGQMCYVACGEGRTWNKDAVKYFLNILQQRHGSVLEHASYTFLLYGVSRSLTHELVRHRAGFGFSQISQRYVDGMVLRFVMRPEFMSDDELREMFYIDIDQAAARYATRANRLLQLQSAGDEALVASRKTGARKNVNQAARSVLPNETEAPIVVTANCRSWRHFLEMRASEHAEPEIRRAAMGIYNCLIQVEPILFGDYQVVQLPGGSQALKTEYIKV